MSTNIKGTNMELTSSITEHINKSLAFVNRFLNDNEAIIYVEVGKTTNHHNKGDIFKAEFDINSNGKKFYAVSQKSDLYLAINDVKDQIVQEFKSKSGKKQTLFKRGATSVKKMLKGLSARNPFTSKY
jgi:putative sigma-54 modulation protein